MPGILNITVDSDQTSQYLLDRALAEQNNVREQCRKLALYFDALASGNEVGRINVAIEDDDGTAASGTVTCTQANAVPDDTCTVCGVVFTVKVAPSSDPADGEFLEGASNTAMATNLTAAINAHPKLKGLVTAGSSVGVVTITAATKGVVGNMFTLAETGTSMVLSGATLASGAVGTVGTPARGYARGKV